MATFKRLTDYKGKEVFVNLDLVQTLKRLPASKETTYSPEMPEHTRVWFTSHGEEIGSADYVDVLEAPMTIVEQGL